MMMLRPCWKKGALVLSVILNIGLLFYFKYCTNVISFLNDVLRNSSGFQLNAINIALPIGISFFTFQGMSYVIDVYRGKVDVQKNPLNIALYISLFPQLIAGPIVRYSLIEHELSHRTVDVDDIYQGIKRFIVGLSKKVLLADTLAYTADLVFGKDISELSPTIAWLGIICFTLQLYYDFSGYSDMAIGLGRIFGFHFPENFIHPYTARSITEFWRKWHITLSSWFRDYVYIPLGGNRRGNVYVHLFIVFLLTGIWHGASFTFVIWGLWHGLFVIVERVLREVWGIDIRNLRFSRVYTLLIVLIGWVFFKSDTIVGAIHYIGAMVGIGTGSNELVQYSLRYYLSNKLIVVLVICLLHSLLPEAIRKLSRVKVINFELVRAVTLFALLALCAVNIVNGNYSPFIYFRF